MLDRKIDCRHNGGKHDAVHAVKAETVVLKHLRDHHAHFIAGIAPRGRQPPITHQMLAVKQRGFDVGIADIEGQNHGKLPLILFLNFADRKRNRRHDQHRNDRLARAGDQAGSADGSQHARIIQAAQNIKQEHQPQIKHRIGKRSDDRR